MSAYDDEDPPSIPRATALAELRRMQGELSRLAASADVLGACIKMQQRLLVVIVETLIEGQS